MVRVPTLEPQIPTQVLTLNVPSDLQPFSTSPKGVMTLVDVEMKLNIAWFSPRHSSKANNSPENEPPIIAPVNVYSVKESLIPGRPAAVANE